MGEPYNTLVDAVKTVYCTIQRARCPDAPDLSQGVLHIPAGKSPGRRLERAIRTAMARQGPAQTMTALSQLAHINRGTLYEWFTDKTEPSPRALGRVAKIIEVPI